LLDNNRCNGLPKDIKNPAQVSAGNHLLMVVFFVLSLGQSTHTSQHFLNSGAAAKQYRKANAAL
jgi:hypothetical protein